MFEESPHTQVLFVVSSKVGLIDPEVLSVQLSKTDISYGETDITVIVEDKGNKIGLLIEDKIDAIAMPDQSLRYLLRGEKGKQNDEYDDFFVFIVAPDKYLSNNNEASKYPNIISYETILKYFGNKDDERSRFKAEQIRCAINKQKTGYQVIEDERTTEFWRRYSDYQIEHYPGLYLLYDKSAKGTRSSWPRFNTVIKGLYMYHKSESGYIDLTFEGCGERLLDIEELLKNVEENYIAEGYTVQKTGKSAAIRLNAPIIDFHKSFDEQINEIEICFNAIVKLDDLVKRFVYNNVQAILQR